MGRTTVSQGLLLSSLLVPGQYATSMSLRHSGHRVLEPSPVPHCAELTNHGTHSTVEVSAGTPKQRFDLVADTGSNAVIILSCACIDAGQCSSKDDCFRGTDASSTFSIGKLSGHEADSAPSITMSFGSGDIQAVIATDEVSVGGVQTSMENGLLLMVDKALNIDGPFEGILGLGLPAASRWGMGLLQEPPTKLKSGEGYEPPEFLTEAKVSQFSICFNNGASGALRLGTPTLPASDKLGSFGEVHWGLGLTGISVGKTKVQLDVCRPDYDGGPAIPAGQSTVCGAIPDSGTTAIMAPEHSLEVLFEGICDNWDRCEKAAKKMHMPKAQAFVDVLADCNSWLEDGNSDGLSELPPLHFRVQGSRHGQIQTLKLDGWFYVFETLEEQYELVSEHFRAFASPHAKSGPKQSGNRRTCAPAFGVMDMPTKDNGDVWILGTSFFYAYNVHYDLDHASMGFVEDSCGSCDDGATLVSQSMRFNSTESARSPRQVYGSWRVSNFNTSGAM